MMHYSIEPRDRILVKGCGFLSFAKNMGKNTDKNISKTKNIYIPKEIYISFIFSDIFIQKGI